MSGEIRIDPLCRHPRWAETLARWHADAFGAWLGGWTWPEALEELRSHDRPEGTPCTWLALVGNEPVGSISLLLEDPPAPAGQGPWLASFFVAPAWRGRGVGGRLHDHCVREAALRGHRLVHLWTPDSVAYYEKRGWRRNGELDAHGTRAILMSMDCPKPTDS